MPAPEIASPLYEVIERAEGIDESTVPAQAYVPTPEGGHVPVGSDGFVGAAGAPGSGGQTLFDAAAHEGK